MKKRLAALVLCLAMSMGTVVEAGAMAENLTSGSAEQTTETESFDVEVTSEVAGVSLDEDTVEMDMFADISIAEEELSADGAEVNDPAAADVPETGEMTGEETQVVEEETTADVEFEDVFSAGEADFGSSEEEIETTAVEFEEELIEAAGADVELGEGEVLASDWKQDTATGKWRLVKRVAEVAQAAGAEETVEEVQAGEEVSVDADETVIEEEVVETAGAEAAYYTSCLVEITTKDATGAAIYEDAWYLFDAEGYLVTGRTTIPAGTEGYEGSASAEYFFMYEAKVTMKNSDDTLAAPYNSNLGQMQKNYNWLWDGGAFHSYGSNGAAVTITANKVYKIDSDYYYILANGVPAVGLKKTTYNGNTGYYYFEAAASATEIPGKMARNKWVKISTDSKKGPRWWFFQSSGVRKATGIIAADLKNNGVLYLVDAYGYLIKGKMTKAADGYYYYTNKAGACYKNKLVKVGGYRYYFLSNGRRATWKNRWAKCAGAGNRYYYFGSVAGRVVEKKGWQKVTVSGKFIGWFYFTSNGNHYMNKWVGDRYFMSDGRLASGVEKVDGKYYFFERSSSTSYKGKRYKNTWVSYDGKWYYATSKGPLLYSRWIKLKGYWYYFQDDCSVKTNSRAKLNGQYGWLNSRGKFETGWIVINDAKNIVRYMDSTTGVLAKNTSMVIDGKTYFFDANGNRITDVTKTKYIAQYKAPYYLEVDRVNGVMTVYNNSSKTVPLKTIRVSVGNPITLTRTGTYTLTRAGRWQALMGPSWGQYGTHVNGGIYIHSIACTYANSYNLPAAEYLKLGSPASHGCIRCCVADAKWVWENCNGSRIRIFDGTYTSSEAKKGPLGRNPLTPLKGAGNYDPTDPAV